MYRTGGDTENDLIENCRGGYGVNMESVHSIESDMRLVKKFMKKKMGGSCATLASTCPRKKQNRWEI